MTLGDLQHARRVDRRTLLTVAGLTLSVLAVEVVGGLWTGSLALLADAGHMLTDLLALVIALVGLVYASRPASARRTWGYHRLEILSAFANGFLLLAVAAVILWQSWQRFLQPREVHAGGMTAVAGVGLLANLVAVWLLSRSSRSLNLRGVLWHMLGDTLSSIGVLGAGVIIAATGVARVDALVSGAIALVIVYGSVRLVWEASDVLLESAPAGLDSSEIDAAMRAVPGVVDVRDLHVWSITTGLPALSGHVIMPADRALDVDDVLEHIKRLLNDRFGIGHSTIQVQTENFQEIDEIH